MNFLFVFVFFIQSAIAHFNDNNNNDFIEGTHCQLSSGEKGTCIRLNMCSSAKDLLKEHKIPDNCGFMKGVPIVCCPKKQKKIERLSEKKCKYFELSRFGYIGDGDASKENIRQEFQIKTEDIPKDFSRFPLVEDENTKDIPTQFSRFPIIEDETEEKTTEKIIDYDAVVFEDDDRISFPLVFSRFGSNSNSFSGHKYKRSEPNEKKNSDDFLFAKDYSQFSYSPTQKYEHNWFNSLAQYNFGELPKLDTSNKDLAAFATRETSNHVLGGENSKPSEFPHMAALGYESNKEIIWLCGGSLISEEYVLTAAHCLSSSEHGTVKKIRLGEINRYPNPFMRYRQEFDVKKVFPYPLYRTNSNYHDIALIKLNGKAVINKYVNTACLFTEEIIPPSLELVATGWGLTSVGGKKSDILQKVELTLFSEEYCSKAYPSSSKLNKGVLHKQQICAGGKEDEKDTCLGDSGGPLQIKTSRSINEDVYYIVGVTSFGKFCGSKNIPGVYSRVSYYIPWIESVIWSGDQ